MGLLFARLLGAATHDLGWPLLAGVVAAGVLAAGLGVHSWAQSLRAEGAATAMAQCAEQSAHESATAVQQLHEQVQAQTAAAAAAQTQILDAERRAAAAHRALDAERAAHEQTRADACASGCTVSLPPS